MTAFFHLVSSLLVCVCVDGKLAKLAFHLSQLQFQARGAGREDGRGGNRGISRAESKELYDLSR